MKTLTENIKCLAVPKQFVGLTFRKGVVGYVMLIMLLAELLINAVPLYLQLNISHAVEEIAQELPEFTYQNGNLNFNSGRKYSYENDDIFVYINTSVERFNAYNEYSDSYYLNYAGVSHIRDIPDRAVFFSRTNCIIVQERKVDEMSLSNLMNEFGITTWDKAQLVDTMSVILYALYAMLLVFDYIGNVIGIFFYALFWGLIVFLINRFQKIKYAYGRMYRLAVYVAVPLRILRMLCIRFIPLPAALITMLYGGLVILYLILAVLLDTNQKLIAADKPTMPEKPNISNSLYDPDNRF